MAKGPREPPGGLGSGHIPDDAFDDGPDTNVDERPAVPLSPLTADSDDTALDQAPTIDPTSRRPLGTPLARPIRERSAQNRPAPTPGPPPKPDPASQSRLRLPLPAGMGGGARAPDEDAPTPPPRITPSLPLSTPEREPPASGAAKVPTMPGVEHRARWPIYAAISAVAVIVIAFLVASEVQGPDGTGALAALGPNATAEARRAEMMRLARMSGQPIGELGPDGRARVPGVRAAPVTRAPPPSSPRRMQPMAPEEPVPFMSILKERPDESKYPKYDDDAAPEMPHQTMLVVESDPPGVPVYLDDVLIGATPILQALPNEKKGGKLVFSKLGFVPKVVNFTVDGPGTKQIFQKIEPDASFETQMKSMASSPRAE